MSADSASPHSHDGPPLPPEPQTPMWLPALGAALFLIAGVWWATRPASPDVIVEDVAGADAGAAPSGSAGAGTAQAGAPGRPDAGALNPDQAAQLQKILQGMGH